MNFTFTSYKKITCTLLTLLLLNACTSENNSDTPLEDNSDTNNIITDTTAPIITLNGDTTFIQPYGETYQELGATAIDDIDGETSVEIQGSIDIYELNDYTLTYHAEDSSGNETSITRTVRVSDLTPPVITLNGSNTLSYQQGETYQELGANAIDNVDGDIKVQIEGEVDTEQVGTYTLTYSAIDQSNNTTTVTRSINVNDAEDTEFTSIALQSSIDQVQPMTGIVFWNTNNSALNDLGNIVQLEYSYLIYSDIVSEKEVYNWDVVDNLLTEVAERGHQAILRFRYTYPGKTASSVPNYIEESAQYNSTIESVEGSNTYLPDWSSQELQDFTLAFFEAFAARYNSDPRIAFLQVGFGSYAEYHLYDGPLDMGYNFPSKDFQTQFLTQLDSDFTQLHWSVSIDAADEGYSPMAANSALTNLTFGLFDDSFMHETHSNNDREYNRSSWLFFGEERYQHSPAGGELNYYSNYDQKNVLNAETGAYGQSFEYFSALYHITYMIGNDQTEYQSNSRIKEAAMATGYQFEITAFQSSSTSSIVSVKNNGVAPLYYDAYLTVNGVQATESLKGLLPEQTLTVTIASGGDAPTLSIESDRLLPEQEIQFKADL